jgi:chorismate lyase/3-hydroxybenzoate synthase
MTQQQIAAPLSLAAPRIEYRLRPAWQEPPPDILFALTFGDGAPEPARGARVRLAPLVGQGLVEVWHANGPVRTGTAGSIRYCADDHFLAAVVELQETTQGGIGTATAQAYREIANFQAASEYPHLLRTWNYLDGINDGEGQAERYRGFCSGRVAGLMGLNQAQHPAATVIGRRDGERVLQVYWLAGRRPGLAIENPRQVSAYRYPRQYGETAPTFSRAMLVAPGTLMISGTASIVGHASRHAGDAREQVREILANLATLLARAHALSPTLPAQLGIGTQIKAYVRREQDAAAVEELLREQLPAGAPLLVLQGDVCRADLLVEFDCLQAVV